MRLAVITMIQANSKKLKVFLRALEIEKQKLGFNNKETAITLNALGENYLELGLYNKQKKYSKSLLIKEKILSPDDKLIATF